MHHGIGQKGGLLLVHAAEIDGHGKGAGLIIWDLAAGVSLHEEFDFFFAKAIAIALRLYNVYHSHGIEYTRAHAILQTKGRIRGNILPMDLFESLAPYYPKDFLIDLAASLQREETHCLLLNERKLSKQKLLEIYPNLIPHPFIPNAFYYDKGEYDLGKSFLHDVGAFYIQDASAMLPAFFLDIQSEDLLLDFSAAPGGKTIGCAFKNPKCSILSNDISYPRHLHTSKNIERLGIASACLCVGDLSKCAATLLGRFDKIILDAPCSGSGMFRKNERTMEDWTYSKVETLSKLQLELLSLCFSFLREGGQLMYSTCSFSYEEDEGVILDFLSRHEDASILPLPTRNGLYSHPSLPGSLHAFPHLYAGEGQFLCLLAKKGDAPHRFCPSPRLDKDALSALKALGIAIPEGYSPIRRGESVYLMKDDLSFASSLPVSMIREGIEACLLSNKQPPAPSLHYTRTLSGEDCLPLSKQEAIKYLRGETFPCSKKGYLPVSYLGMPLGQIKCSGGIAKNHYPKGLRRTYLLP